MAVPSVFFFGPYFYREWWPILAGLGSFLRSSIFGRTLSQRFWRLSAISFLRKQFDLLALSEGPELALRSCAWALGLWSLIKGLGGLAPLLSSLSTLRLGSLSLPASALDPKVLASISELGSKVSSLEVALTLRLSELERELALLRASAKEKASWRPRVLEANEFDKAF